MSAGDPRFFARTAPQPLAAVAAACGTPAPAEQAERLFVGVAPLQTAGPEHVSFFDNRRYAAALAETRAGAVIVAPAMAGRVPAGSIALVTKEAYLGWARVAALFHPDPPAVAGVHPSAVVDPSATVDPSAEIGPGAVIGAGAEIGPRCRIAPLAVIGDGVTLGPDCRVGSHASLSHAMIGARVRIYPGARVGQEGFGFAITATGPVSVPQLGRVIIEDDVEVGANATIDRGSAQDTVIGAGSRLDNLVQIGHNVRLGRCCVIVAQVGISGSAVLEDFVMLGGQSGVTGHIRVGRGARVSAQAGVMKDVPPGAEMAGTPAMPAREVFRQIVALKRLGAAGGAAKEAVAGDEGRTGSG
jgi:UDP-3-O-[3-hydroxymyristoyl] glucosamine N-acyltransferase